METKKIKIGDLVIDPKLTELRHINPVVVSRYRQAYRNGASMPPIIVQKGTERVVSGNHRCTALKQEYNNDDFVVVEEREYVNEREVLEDFFKENSTHGMPLDDFTKKKIINALINEGASPEELAKTFNLPIKRIEKFGEGSVMVIIGNKTIEQPCKRGFEPEKVLSEEEYQDHSLKDRGFPINQQVNQLMRWITSDLISVNDGNLSLLRALRNEIDKYLKRNEKNKVA